MAPDEKRYTDQEVALVLRRAAEIDETRGGVSSARGLTRGDIEQVALEVGLSAEVVGQALADLKTRGPREPASPLGPAPVAKRTQAIPRKLDDSELKEVVRLLEDKLSTPGTVTEALGTVRWTSVAVGHGLHKTTQVTITPDEDETHLQVLSRYPTKFRAVVQLIPLVQGSVLGAGLAASAGLAVLPFIGVTAGIGLTAGAIGKGVWHYMANRNEKQVDKLAAELSADIKG